MAASHEKRHGPCSAAQRAWETLMCKPPCGRRYTHAASPDASLSRSAILEVLEGMALLDYVGREGLELFYGRQTGRLYRAGRYRPFLTTDPRDVEGLLAERGKDDELLFVEHPKETVIVERVGDPAGDLGDVPIGSVVDNGRWADAAERGAGDI